MKGLKTKPFREENTCSIKITGGDDHPEKITGDVSTIPRDRLLCQLRINKKYKFYDFIKDVPLIGSWIHAVYMQSLITKCASVLYSSPECNKPHMFV